MNKHTLQHMDKAAYIALMILAALAILTAMITGPLGLETISVTAAACAIVICVLMLLRTVRALRSPNRRK